MHGLLFTECGPLSGYLVELEQLADRLVDEMAEEELVERPPEEHANVLERRLTPCLPELLLDRVTVRREVTPGESFMVFTVPFSGTGALFSYTPRGSVGTMPRGTVSGVLTIAVSMTDRDSDAIERAYRCAVEQITDNLRAAAVELASFEAGLSGRLVTGLTTRLARVAKERAVAEELSRRFCLAKGTGVDSAQGAAP